MRKFWRPPRSPRRITRRPIKNSICRGVSQGQNKKKTFSCNLFRKYTFYSQKNSKDPIFFTAKARRHKINITGSPTSVALVLNKHHRLEKQLLPPRMNCFIREVHCDSHNAEFAEIVMRPTAKDISLQRYKFAIEILIELETVGRWFITFSVKALNRHEQAEYKEMIQKTWAAT